MVQPSAAGVLAGEQPLALEEAPMAELCSSLLISSGPVDHILWLAKPGAAAESAFDVDDGLGATQPGVFKWFLYSESLAPVV